MRLYVHQFKKPDSDVWLYQSSHQLPADALNAQYEWSLNVQGLDSRIVVVEATIVLVHGPAPEASKGTWSSSQPSVQNIPKGGA